MKVDCPVCQFENQADSSQIICARCAVIIEVRGIEKDELENAGQIIEAGKSYSISEEDIYATQYQTKIVALPVTQETELDKDSKQQILEESKSPSLLKDPYNLTGHTLVGRYRIDRLIGMGGMGAVYMAYQHPLDRVVAIKILQPQLSTLDHRVRQLFVREAQIVARLNHPNIVAVYDAGQTDEDLAYIAMEWLEGHTLDEEISEHRQLNFDKAADILRQISAALEFAHSYGIIHRDLKPQNIMLVGSNDGHQRVKVLDFGIAKILDNKAGSLVSVIAGTPHYMSPEQCKSDGFIDGRSDIYSLGIVLFQMLTGTLPFEGASFHELMHSREGVLPPLRARRPDAPKAVEDLLNRMLAKSPDQRPRNIGDIPRLFDLALGHVARKRIQSTNPTSLPNLASPPISDNPFTALPMTGHVAHPPELTLSISVNLLRRCLAFTSRFFSSILFWLYRFRKRNTTVSNLKTHREQSPYPINQNEPTEEFPPTGKTVSDNLTVHLTTFKPQTDKRDQSLSTTVMLRHSEVFRHNEEHIFEELVLHKDYERLWRSLLHAGSVRNLLTGYGPFGGTSLVKCAIAKARTELQGEGKSDTALLAFYFRVTHETKDNFEIEATDLGFSHIRKKPEAIHNSDMEELEARANSNQEAAKQVMNFSLNKPLETAFFTSLVEGEIKSKTPEKDYDFSKLVADLNAFLKHRKTSKALKNIIIRLAESESLSSRVIFVIDKIKYLETLETLSESDLFNNKRTRVIAVARKEDVDSWRNTRQRLRSIAFSKWYVPCLWNIDIDASLFNKASNWMPVLEPEYRLFLKHLEYKGRGSLGNIIDELKQPSNTNYGSGSGFVDIPTLITRPSIQHNAWVQHVLSLNWDFILGDHFGGPDQDERSDKARIGIYHLLDWMVENRRFSLQHAIIASQKFTVTISDDADATNETVTNLLHVLTRNKYLSLKEKTYRIVWNKDKSLRHRKVKQNWRKAPSGQKTDELGDSLNASSQPDFPNETNVDSYSSEQCNPLKDKAGLVQQELTTDTLSMEPRLADKIILKDKNPEKQNLIPGLTEYSPAIKHLTEKQEVRLEESTKRGKKVLKTIIETVTKKTQVITEGETTMKIRTNILVVFANPKDSDPLRLSAEDRTIRECIKRSNNRDNLNYKIIHAARIKDVQRELLEGEFQIVHFSGHGAPSGQLALEDENGDAKFVPQHALAGLLSKFQSINCVILNACYSLEQGKAISLGVPFVIAMDGPISDEAAHHFARGFYDTIGAGKDCRFAYQMGCDAIALEGYSEELTPKYYEK